MTADINSIYLNNEPINEILSPCTVTITLKKIHQINNKPRKGFLSNIDFLDILNRVTKHLYN